MIDKVLFVHNFNGSATFLWSDSPYSSVSLPLNDIIKMRISSIFFLSLTILQISCALGTTTTSPATTSAASTTASDKAGSENAVFSHKKKNKKKKDKDDDDDDSGKKFAKNSGQSGSFKWKQCEKHKTKLQIHKFNVRPDPLKFPGTVKTDLKMKLKEPVTDKMNLQVTIKKKGLGGMYYIQPCLLGEPKGE